MYRDGIPLRTEDHVNFILSHSALGDMISSLPAIIYARKTNTLDIGMTVWLPEHQIPLVEHLIGGVGLRFMPLHTFKQKVDAGSADLAGPGVINAVFHNTMTRNKIDMVDFAHLTLLDRMPMNDAERCYPHWAPLGPCPVNAPYVVIPVGATSGTRDFLPPVLEPILRWLVENGYLPVILGKSETNVKVVGSDVPLKVTDHFDQLPEDLREVCLDMRDKTTLLEARDWCGHARAVVGLDGGTLHLAGTTDVPIVYGITHVLPEHRPIVRYNERNWELRHVTPRNLACAGCQSRWTLMFKHDFRNCAYGDFKCVSALHPDDFIDALKHFGL